MNKDKKMSGTTIVLIIIGVVISILVIYHTISDLNGDIRRLDQQAEEMKKTTTRITFNCPYCKSFVSIDKDRIFSNICTCPNCRKDLIIKDGIVKVYK